MTINHLKIAIYFAFLYFFQLSKLISISNSYQVLVMITFMQKKTIIIPNLQMRKLKFRQFGKKKKKTNLLISSLLTEPIFKH